MKAKDLDRNEDLAKDKDVREHLLNVYKDVEKGFDDQWERSSKNREYWDIYNCKLGQNQFYSGNSRIFVPIVNNAIDARKTRFSNQLFPVSGRHVEVTTEDGTLPHAIMALLEHYVEKARLRELIPALIRNGDVEGQYNLYVHWVKNERHVVQRVQRPIEIEIDGDNISYPDEDMVDVKEEKLVHQYPAVEILADADVLVLPQTVDSIEEAVQNGGSVTVLRRWGKAKLKKMAASGELDEEMVEQLIEEMSKDMGRGPMVDKAKDAVDAAGIKSDGRGKWALVYETWSKVEVEEGEWRICRTFFAGQDKILSSKRNPLWSDKLPVISAPVEKIQGSFKGVSKVAAVADLQYLANDSINEAADSAAFAMMPIIMTDPEKNPKIGSMVLNLAAVWETSPNDTKFAQFPELWKQGLEMVSSIKSEILQSLSVNPAMITGGAKKKQSQAEVANEQQIDLLSTADAVTVLESAILTTVVSRFLELDHQYRDDAVTVRQYGQLGMQAEMQRIEPIQFNRRYQFRWFGVEAARTTQQVQQQIAAMNVIKGIPPQQYQGYTLDLAPVLVQLVENAFGPRLAPLIFKDMRSQLSHNPAEENTYLSQGLMMPVHPLDDHKAHMQEHMKALQETGDPHGTIREHLMRHQMLMAEAAQAQAQAMQPKGLPGGPGGAGPGVAGAPRPGGQVVGPRGVMQQPAGAVRPDQMPTAMPRKM